MTWTIEWDDRARTELRRLDLQAQREVLRYFRERIATDEDSRRFGKPLRHKLQGLWRYRAGFRYCSSQHNLSINYSNHFSSRHTMVTAQRINKYEHKMNPYLKQLGPTLRAGRKNKKLNQTEATNTADTERLEKTQANTCDGSQIGGLHLVDRGMDYVSDAFAQSIKDTTRFCNIN